MPPSGGAAALGSGSAEDVAPHACGVDLLVQAGDDGVQLGGVVAGPFGGITLGLDVGAELDESALFLVGLVGCDGGFGVDGPALAALGHPELPVPFGAGRALAVKQRRGAPPYTPPAIATPPLVKERLGPLAPTATRPYSYESSQCRWPLASQAQLFSHY